jgi:hypothetical protein
MASKSFALANPLYLKDSLMVKGFDALNQVYIAHLEWIVQNPIATTSFFE